MRNYFVYILLCADNSYNTGITKDIERRVHEHETGNDINSYTFKKRPIKLVFQELFPLVEQAIAFEKQVKDWNRRKKEVLINNDWESLPELSKRRT